MLRINDIPELPVDFSVEIVAAVDKRLFIIVVTIVIIAPSNRRIGRILSEASIGVRAVIGHSWACHIFVGIILLPVRILITLPVVHA